MDLDAVKSEAPKEVVKMAAYLLAFTALLNWMNVATKQDVTDAKVDIMEEVQRNEYRQNLIAITYQQREGVTLFGWTIDDSFAGPMPTKREEPE